MPRVRTPIRLLLVEFLNADRFCQYRSEMFPFVRGWCQDHDIELRWICFGFAPRDMPTSPLLLWLPEDEAAALGAAVREFAPTHVLLNERLDEPLDGQVRAAAGAAKVEDSGAVSDLWPEIWYLRDLEAWLGIPEGERQDRGASPICLADVAVPDYACELLNRKAHEIKPFVQVIAGAPCLYHTPIQCVPEFADIDLTDARRQFGCTFCTGGADARYFYTETPLLELVLLQIRRATETLPEGRRSGEFLLLGTLVFLKMRQFFDAVLAAGVPPSHFFFWCRIDELARRSAVIDETLPRLREPGHAINVWNIGVENFAPDENRRFNKGIDLDEVEEAYGHITRWERDYPDSFRFHVHGGFGYILFTPWTTLADLRINLEKAERYGVQRGSLFFYSRLQLFPALPITLLAEKDGLLADAWDAPEFAHIGAYVAKLSEDQTELPWRFRDPVVAAVFGVFIRLDEPWKRGLFGADEAFARVQALLRRRLPPERRDVYRFCETVLDVAAEHPEVQTATDVVDLVEARLADVLLPDEAPVEETPQETLTPLDRTRRALEAKTRELLALLEGNPRRLLLGFRAVEVSTRDADGSWEVRFVLQRDAERQPAEGAEREPSEGAERAPSQAPSRVSERIGVRFVPREAAPFAFKRTATFAVMHDEDTPVDTDERRGLLDLLARAIERYLGRVVAERAAAESRGAAAAG